MAQQKFRKWMLDKAGWMFHLKKHDVGDINVDAKINMLSYDDILDFAELVEESWLSTEHQRDRCDAILQVTNIEKYTKPSIIHYIVRDHMLERSDGMIIRPDDGRE